MRVYDYRRGGNPRPIETVSAGRGGGKVPVNEKCPFPGCLLGDVHVDPPFETPHAVDMDGRFVRVAL